MEQVYGGSEAAIFIVVVGIIFFVFLLMLLPTIFYLISMQKALTRCDPKNRLMQPGLVWLNLIPFFAMIWQFFTVLYVSGSIDREFRDRGINAEPEPGKSVGLAMCILNVCGLVPYVGILTSIGSLVCWIIYWVKIAECSRKLAELPPAYSVCEPEEPSMG